MLRTIRITLAALFGIGLSLLFLDFTGTAHNWLGWMAKTQALEAVLAMNFGVVAFLVMLTLLCGRIYCSVICPLGILQDVFGWMGKKTKKNRYTYSKELRYLRGLMLVIFLVALLAGFAAVYDLLAPYAAFGRIITLVFQPLWELCNNVLTAIAEHYESYAFYSTDVWMKSLPVLIVAIVTLVLLAVLAWRNGRTYCNTACPVGTLLSFLSRFSFLKIYFDTQKCRNCSLCTKNCKASCIDYKTHTVDYSRCVVCGDCIKSCKFGSLKYDNPKFHNKAHKANGANETYKSPESPDSLAPKDASRRSFLLSSALIATAAMAQEAKKVDGGYIDLEDKVAPKRQTPLTPPGSLSAQNLAQHCTGCQLCISECPNDVLRPSSDLMHFMQPTMSYERGHCRPECNRCSQVCPAGAIKPIDKDEKSSIQIGHAVWIQKNCVPITDGVECGNCARHCPAGAIEMVPLDENDEESPYVPAINEESCIGCGACEYVCPSRPFSAIYVEGHEVHRII